MTTTLSSKGQVVLNAAIRRSLGLVPGTVFSVHQDHRSIILEPVSSGKPRARLVKDANSGCTVLEVPDNLPPLTSERVRALLADFP